MRLLLQVSSSFVFQRLRVFNVTCPGRPGIRQSQCFSTESSRVILWKDTQSERAGRKPRTSSSSTAESKYRAKELKADASHYNNCRMAYPTAHSSRGVAIFGHCVRGSERFSMPSPYTVSPLFPRTMERQAIQSNSNFLASEPALAQEIEGLDTKFHLLYLTSMLAFRKISAGTAEQESGLRLVLQWSEAPVILVNSCLLCLCRKDAQRKSQSSCLRRPTAKTYVECSRCAIHCAVTEYQQKDCHGTPLHNIVPLFS